MAYDDEKAIKTTLLEGAVKVTKNNNSVLLKPSQQATLTKTNNDLRVKDDIDTNEETAWIHGMFQFNDVDLPTILRQLSRWYNVEVSFSNVVPADHFTGKISRNVSLSNVLKILELSDVHFKIEGRKIIVTS
jgi:ferric-dicitrate binding protein FerR (iron transport regulator)